MLHEHLHSVNRKLESCVKLNCHLHIKKDVQLCFLQHITLRHVQPYEHPKPLSPGLLKPHLFTRKLSERLLGQTVLSIHAAVHVLTLPKMQLWVGVGVGADCWGVNFCKHNSL